MQPRILAVVVIVAACSGSSERTPGPSAPVAAPPLIAPPEPPGGPPYQLPAAEEPPPFTMQCEKFGKPAATPKPKYKTYDFASVQLPTTVTVPRIGERPRRGAARTPIQLHDAMGRTGGIIACWQWAQAKGKLESTRVDVSFRIDPWGRLSEIDATSAHVGTDGLTACIEEMMATTIVTGVTTRWTHAVVPLHLSVVDQPAWKKPPKRPKRGTAATRAGTICTPVLSGQPDDEVVLAVPLEYSDYDASRGSSGGAAAIRVACPSYSRDSPGKTAIRRDVHANLGGFAACHAEARQRVPDLTGELTLSWMYGHGGVPEAVTVGGAGDALLHDCMRAALGELWLDPSGPTTIIVNWTFELTEPVAAATNDPHDAASALLDIHDPDGALAAWEALLIAAPDDPDACRWRVGVLRGEIARAPWLDDARVRGALDDLVRHAGTLDDDDARACLVEAEAPLDILLGPIDRTDRVSVDVFEAAWQERMVVLEALLPVMDLLANPEQLREVHLLGLALGDPEEAIQQLGVHGAGTGKLAEWARQAEASLRRQPDVLGRRCSGDGL